LSRARKDRAVVEQFGGAVAEDFVHFVSKSSIEIEFAYHNGDQAVLKAKRETSSTAC
jgi:hypothetical protein